MKEIKHQIYDESNVYIGDQVDVQVYRQVLNQVEHQVYRQVGHQVRGQVWDQIVHDARQNNFDLLPERTIVFFHDSVVASTKKTSTPSGNFLIPYISKLFQKMRGCWGKMLSG